MYESKRKENKLQKKGENKNSFRSCLKLGPFKVAQCV